MPKYFVYILVVIIFIQTIFSFYYSSEIINQNSQLYQSQIEYQNLKIENQNLEKKFTELTSINYLLSKQQEKSFVYVNQRINLKWKFLELKQYL